MHRRKFLSSILAGVASLPFLSVSSLAKPSKEEVMLQIQTPLRDALNKCLFEINDYKTRTRFLNELHNGVRKIPAVAEIRDFTAIVLDADIANKPSDMEGSLYVSFEDGERREMKFGIYSTGVKLEDIV